MREVAVVGRAMAARVAHPGIGPRGLDRRHPRHDSSIVPTSPTADPLPVFIFIFISAIVIVVIVIACFIAYMIFVYLK